MVTSKPSTYIYLDILVIHIGHLDRSYVKIWAGKGIEEEESLKIDADFQLAGLTVFSQNPMWIVAQSSKFNRQELILEVKLRALEEKGKLLPTLPLEKPQGYIINRIQEVGLSVFNVVL